jgi:hypothetical protein
MCPGCGARGCGCRWINGALVLTCEECESEFTCNPNTRSLAGATRSDRVLTRHLNQEDRIMMVKAEGSVQGYVERKGKEDRVYRSMDLYVKGKDPGNLRLNIPEEHQHLIEICKQSEGMQARASVEIRKFEQTGKIFFDLTGLEILK